MANSGANTNGSQFFIITGDQGAQLPPNYSLFGQVTDGFDTTVKAMEAAANPDASANGVPADGAHHDHQGDDHRGLSRRLRPGRRSRPRRWCRVMTV